MAEPAGAATPPPGRRSLSVALTGSLPYLGSPIDPDEGLTGERLSSFAPGMSGLSLSVMRGSRTATSLRCHTCIAGGAGDQRAGSPAGEPGMRGKEFIQMVKKVLIAAAAAAATMLGTPVSLSLAPHPTGRLPKLTTAA